MKMDWLLFSFAAMALFSVSNLLLKILVSNPSFSKINYNDFLLPIALVAIGIVGFLYLLSQNNAKLFPYALGIAVLSIIGFAAMVFALQRGKAALVTAVLSLSTIAVAGLSFYFLGDRFSVKETLAIIFASLSVLV